MPLDAEQVNAVAHGLSLFFNAEDVFEVRVLGARSNPLAKIAGYVPASQIKRYAGTIVSISEGASGAYFTPQLLKPEALARSPGHFPEVVKRDGEIRPVMTCDADVVGRRYLLIDVDPVRARGQEKQSSTDGEKQAAHRVLEVLVGHLVVMGWHSPVLIDSGNGYHAYFRLPSIEPGGSVNSDTDEVACLLRVLASLHDTDGAKVDTAVYNPSRIMKIPGTFARKGKATTERPHRMCRVLEVPSGWQ